MKTAKNAEINKALEFLKSKHNGEIPYAFERQEMGRWMAEYASLKAKETAISFALYNEREDNPDHRYAYERVYSEFTKQKEQ